ncbi:hypothetical protein ACNRBS_01295 [Ralstonia pseudosolanacearum]|uniref:hypothetical protein n=1 Tax=Ralstonia pseudosolanacearum TaxID=1310165 RepID=UPI003AAC952C
MFDITPDDIALLNDIDLRELVGRLCEAELATRDLSPAAVTWGGNQTAADGGLDVRVALPPGKHIEGFIPRCATGFQVKTPDMPRAEILKEMRPGGTIRQVIQQLADSRGAYIIVSSHGSTTDSALGNRRRALREALDDVSNADDLHTDFYDRARLATWVRLHPGLITWVQEKLGRALVGWRPYGSWSGPAEGVDAEYLVDDKLRIHLGTHRDTPGQSVAQAIDGLRDELAQPRKIMRLVGLSGVGKTRLVQALFDTRVGTRPLQASLAVYTNLSDNPDPQPIGLASDLIASRTRAILIVDNCPPDLHRRLSDLCRVEASTVSVLTVEYDVRDDQPEGTQVVTLETSSLELIEKLIRRRYRQISQVDARTIAGASGGNARIAIALAESVERSGSIAGLSDEQLFERLFRQQQESNNALLLAAQACSLVYSFQGEALEGAEAELPRLATLAGQNATETYRHVQELIRRDLVQLRADWRAVLPHAIANRLASRALDDTPYALIKAQFLAGGADRLARSFSRRLSFLHEHPKAIAIARDWLSPNGLLGDATAFNDLSQAMFENVAPVAPEAAMLALERVGDRHPDLAVSTWQQHRSLLRSLAYEPALFERSVRLLARAATENTNKRVAKSASDVFISLFPIYLSGTHATIEQRLAVVEHLLKSGTAEARTLGLAALGRVLETSHFSSNHHFEFGARSRNHGYNPRGRDEIAQWYAGALTLIDRLALIEGVLRPELCSLLGRHFYGLWTWAGMHGELEGLSRRIAAHGFWREGWVACRKTILLDHDVLTKEIKERLSSLEVELRPTRLADQVRAIVLGQGAGGLSLEDWEEEGDPANAHERAETIAGKLGAAVARNDAVLAEVLPELLRGGARVWAFGHGLASGSQDPRATWGKLVEDLERTPLEQASTQVHKGFLSALWLQDKNLANELLDSVLDRPALLPTIPALHSAVELDERGVERLKRGLLSSQIPIRTYGNLAIGRSTEHLAGDALKDLLVLIAEQPDGFHIALEILSTRLHFDEQAKRENETELLEVGRSLLERIPFSKSNENGDYELSVVARTCLMAEDSGPIAANVATQLKQALARYETYAYNNEDLLTALLETQPLVTLDALLGGNDEEQLAGIGAFDFQDTHRTNPADAITCEKLVAWCAAEPDRRFPLAASVVTFTDRSESSGHQVWSGQAKALLAAAPDIQNVLDAFIKRFRPNSWSGSRAALMEANARLLDDFELDTSSNATAFVARAKATLAQEIAQERQWETEQDRGRDERFE